MKTRSLFLGGFLAAFSSAFAGNATLYNNAESVTSIQGSGTVFFNNYNATSVTISAGANASGASEQGGGRNYRGHAEAVIGSWRDDHTEDPGSDPMSMSASLTLTFTRQANGNWYNGGTNVGSSINVSSAAFVDGENAVGGGNAYANVSWVDAPANRAPTIAWTATQGSVGSGQGYTISAHGRDADGNLSIVCIWKNGQPFAFAGGGNGFDGDSENPTVDSGPATVTFTAQAFDAGGASSGVISQKVTIAASNSPPGIQWTNTPGTIDGGQTYTVSAHGHDANGNLTAVCIWKNGQPFAFAGGGNGTDGDSENPTADNGPTTITFTAQAFDGAGGSSGVIAQTVTIRAANHAPTIAWNSTPGTVASGQSYTVAAHGSDADGNLAQVNVWRNGTPFAFAGSGNGFDGDSGNASSDTGPQTVTYTAQAVDAKGASSGVISQTVTIGAANRAPTVAWSSSPGTVASGQNYSVAAHGHDADSNLTLVRIWKNGSLLATTNASGADGDVSGGSADPGPATVTFTAQAIDASGATSGTISQVVTITAPASVKYTLTTVAGSGGTMTGGGTYDAGTVLTLSASGDGAHDFSGWSGDAGGTAMPLTIALDRNKTVQANFTPKLFALSTGTNGGGSVTPGGSYPMGTWVTISQTPDAMHRFGGWSGDATGSAASVAIFMDRAKTVEAVFLGKLSQTISFAAPGDHAASAPAFGLSASASSGLPVNFSVVSGPALISAGSITLTGSGAIVVQANQPGDGTYLPAAPVTQSFNVIAPVTIKYEPAARTLIERSSGAAPFVVNAP